jgi:acyl carrier protein
MTPNLQRLLSIIETELGVDPTTLAPDSLLTDLADSLDWVNLLGALEDSFGLKISTEQGLLLRTLQDVIHLVSEPGLVAA